MPGKYIGLMEKSGLIVKFDYYMFEKDWGTPEPETDDADDDWGSDDDDDDYAGTMESLND